MDRTEMNRRDFMNQTAKTATVAALAGMIAKPASSRVLGANDTIRIGIIGTGGRGQWGMKECIAAGAQIAAVCDVWDVRRNAAKAKAKELGGGDPDPYLDYQDLLAREDIDGVYIAVPDHWHHDTLIDSVKAGKDAYCEKPFSKSIEEGKNMVKEVRKTDRIVQVGNHRRSGDHWLRARDVIRSGKIGKVAWVRVFDTRDWSRGDPFLNEEFHGEVDWKRFCGKAPKQPFDVKRFLAWRWFWDFAGGLTTDIGAHMIDIVQWLMDAEGPKSAASNGGNYYFDFWQTPDVVNNVLDYGTFLANFDVQFVNGHDDVGGTFYGSEGVLVVNGHHRVYLRVDNKETPDIDESKQPVEEWQGKYEGPAHVRNWLDCMRTRKEPNSPVEVGHKVICAAHLCNLSYRNGKTMFYNPETQDYC